MTLITPEQGTSRIEDRIGSISNQLESLRKSLEDLEQQVRAGEVGTETDARKQMSAIQNMVRLALDAEMKLDEQRKRKAGIVNDYALDFDAARSSIGCRLGRLRAARCPGRIPE